jgi:hypothetical protein
MNPTEAVAAWQRFATNLYVEWQGQRRSWASHIVGSGFADEETLLQPVVFPRFAAEFLGFLVGDNLAPETSGAEGKPDFRPSDAGTHPFVFETKSTKALHDFAPFAPQVTRYLVEGRSRIRKVVVTNLVGLQVFELEASGSLSRTFNIDLRALLHGTPDTLAHLPIARQFANFIREFSFQELTSDQKLARIKSAEEWNPVLEVTNPAWVSAQLDRVVERLRSDIEHQVASGALLDRRVVDPRAAAAIVDELRDLDFRLGGTTEDAASRTLDDYLTADDETSHGRALRQYEAHAAYFVATRLMVVRIWEDLGLLAELLRDGGFHEWMLTFKEAVADVVDRSMTIAGRHYPSLFSAATNYSWFAPHESTLTDVLFDLSNVYFGEVETDVLGDVYQRLLERVDRKNVGQFYTPRDVIRLIWDLVDLEPIASEAAAEGREVRVLDIATGSGGFLVEAARTLRTRAEAARSRGAALKLSNVVDDLARGLVGVELQRFPAYLAEVNLLLQIGFLLKKDFGARLPPISVLCADTMSLHESDPDDASEARKVDELVRRFDSHREDTFRRVKFADRSEFIFDVACGNPPYIGEKRAASILARTRAQFPYWSDFIGPHLDVLYWFLILGVSKLRQGGRFSFITTEYWLRADGASALRGYLARNCHIERVLLFGDLKLFPDAPGQHSMVVIGTRVTERDGSGTVAPHAPRISRYEGPNLDEVSRRTVLEAFRTGSRAGGVVNFDASVSPNSLNDKSWGELVLSPAQFKKRARLRKRSSPLELHMEEGVIATPDRLRRDGDAELLPAATVRAVDYPRTKPAIFVFNEADVASLGPLNAAEQRALRPMVNTKDVFPYASVVGDGASRLLYLARPPAARGTAIERVQTAPFPSGMPKLEMHLRRFEPLLRAKVEGWRERRPWWSVHRPRLDSISQDEQATRGWSGYAVTTRWGGGGRLTAGLAPAGSVPASGLHTLYPSSPASAAYLVGVLHSSPVQDLVDSLPPGEIRQSDLQALGVPWVPDLHDEVARRTLDLADLVQTLVTDSATGWPLIPDVLRSDAALSVVSLDTWLLPPLPVMSAGELRHVHWTTELRPSGPQSSRIRDVTVQRDLFGVSVVAHGSPRGALSIVVQTDDDVALDAIIAVIRGQAACGRALRDLPTVLVPLTVDELVDRHAADSMTLLRRVEEYRRLRSEIEAIVLPVL